MMRWRRMTRRCASYRPDTAPLAYASTQNNRANRLSELATLPGEERRSGV